MTVLPTGTVTFLFTDIEGSTRLWERDARRMQLALARHDEILKSLVEGHGGFVFKMMGDACCAAFSEAPEALAAALSAQRAMFKEPWDEECRIRVRMSLHTGEAEERDGDYFGPAVNRVARLLVSGHGGQTLLSRATRELVGDRLPPGADLKDMGDHRLRDLKEPERIFQLLTPDLPTEFPLLKTLEAPSEDDRYRLIKQLGSGGMADVYLAYDEVLEREVAFKVLDRKHAQNRESIERFRREARNAASMHDPSIVSIFDRGHTEDGTYYIVMEYMEGGTLEDLIRSEGPLSPQRTTEVALQVARALFVAHRMSVIHRDIKPQNILLSKSGEAKVGDFGIARAASATTMTQAGSILGTVHYISPEQALGEPATPRSDLYSLGVVLYEMLTGELPYDAETPAGIVMKHVDGPPRSPRETNPKVPEDLDAVTVRLLAKDAEDRYPDASALIEDLGRAKQGLPLDVTTRDWRSAKKVGMRFQRPSVFAAMALVLVSMGIMAFVMLTRGGPEANSGVFSEARDIQRVSLIEIPAPKSPGRYATDAFTFELVKGWAISAEYNDNLELVPQAEAAKINKIRNLTYSSVTFNRVEQIFDPEEQATTKRNTLAGATNPMPDDIITWLQEHPYLDTSEAEPVEVGNKLGLQIDIEVSPVPRKYRGSCGDNPCIVLFDTKGQPISIPAGGKSRLMEFKNIDGDTMIIVSTAYPTDNFSTFIPKAQEILNSVKWKDT